MAIPSHRVPTRTSSTCTGSTGGGTPTSRFHSGHFYTTGGRPMIVLHPNVVRALDQRPRSRTAATPSNSGGDVLYEGEAQVWEATAG